jgi:hypothetical protein
MTKKRGKGASKGREFHLKSIVPDTATAISVMAVTSKRISIRVCMTSLTVLPQARRPHCTTCN